MRWAVLLLVLVTVSVAQDKLILSTEPPPLPKKPPPKSSCAVQELYVIGWTMHDPTERQKAMLDWLDRTKCSSDDYVNIWNALPELAGTSDSPLLRAKIIEKAGKK